MRIGLSIFLGKQAKKRLTISYGLMAHSTRISVLRFGPRASIHRFVEPSEHSRSNAPCAFWPVSKRSRVQRDITAERDVLSRDLLDILNVVVLTRLPTASFRLSRVTPATQEDLVGRVITRAIRPALGVKKCWGQPAAPIASLINTDLGMAACGSPRFFTPSSLGFPASRCRSARGAARHHCGQGRALA